MADIRDEIFRSVANTQVSAAVVAENTGIVVETAAAAAGAADLGLAVERVLPDGSPVLPGDEVVRICGTPRQVAEAEDRLIGIMAKASGIASAARRFAQSAGPQIRVVSGAWKKMPLSQKQMIRRALAVGGVHGNMSDEPFLYLDKNYVRMLGGIVASLDAVARLGQAVRVIQVRGEWSAIEEEACLAARHGAQIVFVDTGDSTDIASVAAALRREDLRVRVRIAFGGNIRPEDMNGLRTTDVDILDIGRSIVDAPMLDMRLDVIRP